MEEEGKIVKSKGKFVGKMIVTIYDNIPGEVELVDLQPRFSFRHFRLAQKAFTKALKQRRRMEARKETPSEKKQKEVAQAQDLVDAQTERVRKEKEVERAASRNVQRIALEEYKLRQKQGVK